MKNDIVVFDADDNALQLNVILEDDTVWLTQKQMSELFDKNVRTVNEHIQNVYKEGELEEQSTIRKFRIVQHEGNREVERVTNGYNLDVVISIGYRVKSQRGTRFRQWATKVLKSHLLQHNQLLQYQQMQINNLAQTFELIQTTMQAKELTCNEAKGLLDVITSYAKTWFLLQKHDENDLPQTLSTGKELFVLDYPEATQAIAELKRELMYQRIGAFMFILFLAKNDLLYETNGTCKINDNALTALALLMAQSDPKAKELMIGLVVSLVGE